MADDPHNYQRYLDDVNNYNWLMDEVLRHETIQGMHVGQYLFKLLGPRYVLDIGCGPGNYLMPFRHEGCQIYGIDGASAAGGMLTKAEFELVDLRQPWLHDRVKLRNTNILPPPRAFKFSLSLCIEVAEHLPEQYARTLVETICNNSLVCYFSAAYETPEGFPQSGEGHFNLRPRAWWLSIFHDYGWGYHSQHRALAELVRKDPEMDHCGWLKTNGMLLTQLEAK